MLDRVFLDQRFLDILLSVGSGFATLSEGSLMYFFHWRLPRGLLIDRHFVTVLSFTPASIAMYTLNAGVCQVILSTPSEGINMRHVTRQWMPYLRCHMSA
jgi:hypothetical protein